ncbi:hypothetical protein M378DRAFT_171447 [Amanita muscaria Koide BX008]|uniref:Uncharacterized protein n=1 Tax=Amanita muscaria (strain Koide BX008) TaxID=946122 RepID=A0A0C2S4V8_AMAMK|nr:hypothetical protein M378DRAFT_171447 [Amanita muscaria Koide BX008]
MDTRRFSFVVVDVSTIDTVTNTACVDTCRPKHCPESQSSRASKVAKDYEKTKEELRRHGGSGKDLTF